MSADPAPAVADADLERELDAICASLPFRHSPQQQRFLRHLIARGRSGDHAALREIALGIDVFRRPAGHYDPKKEPIVRIEARRLRERLARYYAAEGAHSGVEIVVPLGGYLPVVRPRSAPAIEAVVPAAARTLEQRALYLSRQRTLEGYRKALELFTRATAEFPGLAFGYRGIAWSRVCIAGHEAVPPEAATQGPPLLAAIEAAARLGPDHPEIGALRGSYAARYEFDLAAAEEHYRRSQCRHGDGFNRSSYAWLCILTGRLALAQRYFAEAQAMDPFGYWHRHNLGSAAYFTRDYPAALTLLTDAKEMEPGHVLVRLVRARVLLKMGRGTEAIAEAQWCARALPGATGLELYRIAALAGAGQVADARAAMRAFGRRVDGLYVSPVYLALAHTALADHDLALECLARAARERDYWLPLVAVNPEFDALRSRTEFAAIIRGAGLPLPEIANLNAGLKA